METNDFVIMLILVGLGIILGVFWGESQNQTIYQDKIIYQDRIIYQDKIIEIPIYQTIDFHGSVLGTEYYFRQSSDGSLKWGGSQNMVLIIDGIER